MDFPAKELDYMVSLASEAWDAPRPVPVRHRYVIFALPRTGSEYLCARLRRIGAGAPIEYFHQFSLKMLAARLGCLDAAGRLDIERYFAGLEAKRTTPNGIFGIKLIARQLSAAAGKDLGRASQLLGRFDRVLYLRRQDRLSQAISYVRALATSQWHVLPGDDVRPVELGEDKLFAQIDGALASLDREEREASRAVATLDPDRVRDFRYEDLAAADKTATALRWLAGETGADAETAMREDHALPIKGDSAEALRIKARYAASRGLSLAAGE